MLSSSEGFVFPLIDLMPKSTIEFSTFERSVQSFITDTITLNVNAPINSTTSGSTIGFYVGMPIKFQGPVNITGINGGETYYVSEVVDETQFKVSQTLLGPTFNFTSNLTVQRLKILIVVVMAP